MALVYKDRVKQVCSAPTTTNPFDFTGAATTTGYQTFVAALADGETCIYAAEDADGDWEVGLGTWTEASDQLARTTILASSNAGSAETFSGDTTVSITWDAQTALRSYKRGIVIVKSDLSTTQSLSSNVETKLASCLVTEVVDENGFWDHTNKKFIPTIAGKYIVSCSMQLASVAAGKVMQLNVKKDGADYLFGPVSEGSGAAFVGIIETDGTDEFEFYGYNGDSVNRSTYAGVGRVSLSAFFVGDNL